MPTLREVVKGVARLAPRTATMSRAAATLLFASGRMPRSIAHYLERAAERWPDVDAVRTPEGAITYRELNLDANRLASQLLRRGVSRGTSVAVMMENRIEMLIALSAVAKLGAASVLVNTQQRNEALLHSLSVCQPKAFLVGEECAASVEEVRARVPAKASAWLWWKDRGQHAMPAGYESASELVAAGEPANPWRDPPVELSETAFYVFTSGTTGLPKASVMSHLRWLKAARAFGDACLRLAPGQVFYAPLPLYHNNAVTIAWGSSVVHGATLATRRKFSAREFWQDCRRFRANAFIYIGEIPQYLLTQPPSPDDAAHGPIKAIGNGLRPAIWEEFKRRFAITEIYEFYAASEMNVSFANVLNLDQTVGVCPATWALVEYDEDTGEPRRGADGRLVEVRKGTPGLFVAEVTSRYNYEGYTDAAASERKLVRNAFVDGDTWFVSGDLLRDVGWWHLQFVDRLGDTFRWKGENVSTLEVERAVARLAGVSDNTVYGVAVTGKPGRAGMVAIVADDTFDIGGAAAQLARDLPPYAVPLFVRRVPQLEVTATFKHRKTTLRVEGFDPAVVGDPMWVLSGSRYVPLDADRQAAVRNGQLRL